MVVYTGSGEVLVCAIEYEQKLIDRYFGNPSYRNIDEYERSIAKYVVKIVSDMFRCDAQ